MINCQTKKKNIITGLRTSDNNLRIYEDIQDERILFLIGDPIKRKEVGNT